MIQNDINKLNILTSEIVAKSIKDIYPNAKLGEKSLTENGFRYSFKLSNAIKLSTNDFDKIKKFIKKNMIQNDINKLNIL